jgi:hypothetical protein
METRTPEQIEQARARQEEIQRQAELWLRDWE